VDSVLDYNFDNIISKQYNIYKMEKQFTPNQDMAKKFSNGVQGKDESTKEQEQKIKQETLAIIEEDIDFLRKKVEFEELQIKSYQNAVLLGRMEPRAVPGLLGLQLLREDIEMQAFLYRQKLAMEQAMKEEKEKEEAANKNKKDSPIIKP
jgi:hypothetical protein